MYLRHELSQPRSHRASFTPVAVAGAKSHGRRFGAWLFLIPFAALLALSGCSIFQEMGFVAPATPIGLTVSGQTASTLYVSWNPETGANSYTLSQSMSQNGTYTQIKTTSGTSYTVINLTSGTTYWFKVASTNAAGSSPASAPVQGTTSSGGGGAGTVATPTFSPGTGTYASPVTVAISTATAGATIYYTIDGTTPSNYSTPYLTAGVNISTTTTLQAIAYKGGMTTSAVASATYTIGSGGATTVPIAAFAAWQVDQLTSVVQLKNFTFNAIAGHTYAISWDDSFSGSGTYSLDISVSAYHQDMTTTFFAGADSSFSYPRTITPTASEVVSIQVTPYTGGNIGTFALIVMDITGFPAISTAIPITYFGSYQSDQLTVSTQTENFIFLATAGHTYTINWDDSYVGSGTYSLDIYVAAYHQDMTTPYFTQTDSGYSSINPKTITPTVNEIVVLQVTPFSSASTGTFALKVTY
jgi:hypothetical protein